MGRSRLTARLVALAALVPLSLALSAVPANADDVRNDVSAGAAGATINNPGGSATVNYRISATGAGTDGQAGCNADDGSPVTVSIVTPAEVTATPASLTFNACGQAAQKPVVFTATTNGTYGITATWADTGIGAYTVSGAAFNLLVQSATPPPPADTTPPVITPTLTPSPPSGTNGWHTTDVSLTWTVSELESPASLVTSGCGDSTVTVDQVSTDYTCSATSEGGPSSRTVSIKRDATAPTDVTFQGGPDDGARYFPSTVPVAPTCTASDATSGLASCEVTGYSSDLGSHTLTATATDNAGNVSTTTASYIVRVLTVNGFFSPVDMSGVVNTVKGGSTVPLKFRIFDLDDELTGVESVKSITMTTMTCNPSAETDAIEQTLNTGSTVLRYDSLGGQFIQNWKTPTKVGCYKVKMTTQGDSTIAALFKIR